MYQHRVLREINTEDFSSVIIPYAVELRYDKRLHLQQSYVLYAGGAPKIRLQFISQDILEMCQARGLLVDVVEGLLDRLNRNIPRTTGFPYPFTAASLEIYIDFESYYSRYVDPYYIGWVVLENGMAWYYAFNAKDYTRDFWNVRHEPYFKSLSFAKIRRRAEKEYENVHKIKAVNLNKEDHELRARNLIRKPDQLLEENTPEAIPNVDPINTGPAPVDDQQLDGSNVPYDNQPDINEYNFYRRGDLPYGEVNIPYQRAEPSYDPRNVHRPVSAPGESRIYPRSPR